MSIENEETGCFDQDCCHLTNPTCRMSKDRKKDEEDDRRQTTEAWPAKSVNPL